MTCQVQQRERVRTAAARLDRDPRVLDVDTLAPGVDPTDRWTLDLVLDGRACDGLVPPVNGLLVEHLLTVRDIQRQGEHVQVVATA